MKYIFTICLMLLLVQLKAQRSFVFTSEAFRAGHDQKLVDSITNRWLNTELSQNSEHEWRKAFWAMELMLYKTAQTKQKLSHAWNSLDTLTENFQKSLLEVIFTLYPRDFERPVLQLLTKTSSPAVFIRAAEYMHRINKNKYDRVIAGQIQMKFSGRNDTGISILLQRIGKRPKHTRPDLKCFFDPAFLPGETVIFSLQRKNRDYPGLVVIRKANGDFLRDHEGRFFHTQQLARAITDYPFYITNGNTPQGIFRWTGFDSSDNNYIGPTTNLQMVMPFEATPAVFFNDNAYASKEWSKDLYKQLLPATCSIDSFMYESFYAGSMGRSEVIMHGTTINPEYYKGQSYFPQTPSMGCLCSYEEWGRDGRLIRSDQQDIVDALQQLGATKGYVVVMDIDDQGKPVSIKEIQHLLH